LAAFRFFIGYFHGNDLYAAVSAPLHPFLIWYCAKLGLRSGVMTAIEQSIVSAIDSHAQQLFALRHTLAACPEPGFGEERTAAYVAQALADAGLVVETGLARTGLRAVLTGGHSGPNAAIIGELDAIACPLHPLANADNGLAHACGHHLQLVALVGAAIALSQPDVRAALCGDVTFLAVPAEEYVSAERRQALQAEGVEFCCGKSEMLRTGVFDNIDLALTTHAHMIPCDAPLLLGNVASTGFVSKRVTFCGQAAHAAAAPHEGVNALNVAALALSAIGMLRETFRESDTVRIHTNIVEGGTALNVVPHRAVMEAMVRASNLPALHQTAARFDNACTGAAFALGAQAQISTLQGYMPVRFAPACEAQRQAAQALGISYDCAAPAMQNFASTDVGDLSHVLPVVNFTHGGIAGALHSPQFSVTDESLACLVPAKMMALTAYHLLCSQAAQARQIMQDFKPVYTKNSYINAVREQFT
jgi:amidohydrolase